MPPKRRSTTAASAQRAGTVPSEPTPCEPKTKRARRTAQHASRGTSSMVSSAAHEAYKASEIMERIYLHCDTPTLATCLYLERSNTATCARYLYHTIPSNIIPKMSRTAARRVVYCDSVRVIDRSYRQNPRKDTFDSPGSDGKLAGAFDAVEFLAALSTYMKKCPNVQRVENEFPNSPTAASYTAHIEVVGAAHHIDLDLHRQIFARGTLVNDGRPVLPPTETYTGIRSVREQLSLVFYGGPHYPPADYFAKWAEYLVGHERDPRIAGLFGFGNTLLLMKDITEREGGSPAKWPWLRRIEMQTYSNTPDLGLLDLTPHLDHLRLSASFPRGHDNIGQLIQAVYERCKHLRELVVTTGDLSPQTATVRDKSMRRLHIRTRNAEVNMLQWARLLAPYVCRRGHCSIEAGNVVGPLGEFAGLVKAYKSTGPNGHALRSGRLNEIEGMSFSDSFGTTLISDATRRLTTKALGSAAAKMLAIREELRIGWAQLDWELCTWIREVQSIEAGLGAGSADLSEARKAVFETRVEAFYARYRNVVDHSARLVGNQVNTVMGKLDKL